MIKKFLAACFLWGISVFLFAETQDLVQVDVMNKSGVVLRSFRNAEDLGGFRKVWEDRAFLKGVENIGAWDFLLEVQTRVTFLQWRYDSKTGLCSLFSSKKMPVYRIRDFEILNRALNALPHQKILWVTLDEPLDLKHEPWVPPYDLREGRRESRMGASVTGYRERKKEEKAGSSLPVFNPSLEGESEEESWEDDSRLVCFSLAEARRRRDESRRKAAERKALADNTAPQGTPGE